MTPLTVEPEFGPKGTIPAEAPAWWACRAINARGTVDIVWDRQSAGGPVRDVLLRFLNGGMLQALKERISAWWRTDAQRQDGATTTFAVATSLHNTSNIYPGAWLLAEKKPDLMCHVRAAGGYFYIAVWTLPHETVPDLTADLGKNGMRALAWSGAVKGYPTPPLPGETVKVTMNGIGPALVLRHFTHEGFLGLVVLPLDPPAWYVKQNGACALGHVYGMEIGTPTLPEAVASVGKLAAQGAITPELASDTLKGRTVAMHVQATPNDDDAPLARPVIADATKAKLRAVFRVVGQIGALKLYRETTGASIAAAKVAVAEICDGLTEREYLVWGTAEVENQRRRDEGLIPSSTDEVVQRKRAEVYTVGYLADGRCLLLTRNYNGIAVVDQEIGDVLTGRIQIALSWAEPVITSRWIDYSLSHDATGIPAGTPMRALWIAHRESMDGKAALRDGTAAHPATF